MKKPVIRPRRAGRVLLGALALVILASSLSAQLTTRKTGRIDEDRFDLDLRLEQFTSATDGRHFSTFWIIPRVGINPRMEMVAWFPFPTVVDAHSVSRWTIGDILVDVKYQLKKNWFRLPVVQEEKDTLYYLNLFVGFNTGVGPLSTEFGGVFYPEHRQRDEVKLGLILGAYAGHLELFANFNQVYAMAKGENDFDFADKAFDFPTASERSNGARTVFLWNVHKNLLKYLWPGKIGPDWPFGNDYLEFNLSLGYWVEYKPIIFRYELFFELNCRKVYNVRFAEVPDQVQIAGGVTARFFKGFKATLAAALPVLSTEFKGPKYTFGLMLSL